MTTYTFTVENDQGKLVKKTESKTWVKDRITQDLQAQGYRTTFRIRQTGDNSVEAYNTKGNGITYHYGGFDDCEVLEPWVHGDWPKKPRKITSWNRYLSNVGFEERIKLEMSLEKQLYEITSKYETDTILKGLTKTIRNQKTAHVKEYAMELRRRVKETA